MTACNDFFSRDSAVVLYISVKHQLCPAVRLLRVVPQQQMSSCWSAAFPRSTDVWRDLERPHYLISGKTTTTSCFSHLLPFCAKAPENVFSVQTLHKGLSDQLPLRILWVDCCWKSRLKGQPPLVWWKLCEMLHTKQRDFKGLNLKCMMKAPAELNSCRFLKITFTYKPAVWWRNLLRSHFIFRIKPAAIGRLWLSPPHTELWPQNTAAAEFSQRP